MTCSPYRSPIFPPVRPTEFTRYLARHRAAARFIRRGVITLLLLPAGVAWGAKANYRPPAHEELPLSSASSTHTAPWGMFVTANDVRPWLGPLPVTAPRPDARSGPLAATDLQSEIMARAAPEIRRCYAATRAGNSDLRAATGILVASVLVHLDGTSQAIVGGDKGLVRAGLAPCVSRALEKLTFRPPPADTEWFHFPVRFVPEPPRD